MTESSSSGSGFAGEVPKPSDERSRPSPSSKPRIPPPKGGKMSSALSWQAAGSPAIWSTLRSLRRAAAVQEPFKSPRDAPSFTEGLSGFRRAHNGRCAVRFVSTKLLPARRYGRAGRHDNASGQPSICAPQSVWPVRRVQRRPTVWNRRHRGPRLEWFPSAAHAQALRCEFDGGSDDTRRSPDPVGLIGCGPSAHARSWSDPEPTPLEPDRRSSGRAVPRASPRPPRSR